MQLSDFFQSFNIYNLSIFAIFIFTMDFIGFKLSKLLKINNDFRIVYWIVGLAFFVFEWFILHLFIPFHPKYVFISLIITFLLSILIRVKYSTSELFKNKTEIIFLLIFLLPFFKLVFFRISLPPRLWDEMAYHFYSPVRLYSEITWNFESAIRLNELDFYMMLPRSVDTMYVIVFALTKTYATAQLLHTMIFLSAILLTTIFIRKKAGIGGLLVFLSLILYSNTELLFASNTGYIDVATASFAIISLLSLFKLIQKPNILNLRTAVLFSAISIGVKYTLVSYLVSTWIISLIVILISNKKIFKMITSEIKSNKIKSFLQAFILLLISIIGGGYWYIKNYFITGNLTYPFSFFCRSCSTGTDKLQGWGYIDFNLGNIAEIVMPLFKNNSALILILIFGIFYIFHKNKKELIKYLTVILLSIALEFYFLSRVGNYTARFFYHWPIIIAILLSLPFKNFIKEKKNKFSLIFMFIGIISIISINFLNQQPIKKAYERISDNDRWFARNKMSLADWLHPGIPHMYETVINCGNNHNIVDYYIADPNLIWGEYGLTRVFLVNCTYQYIKLDSNAEKTYENIPKNLTILSTEKCFTDEKDKPSFTNPDMIEFEKLNQMLVCEREETGRFLYTK